MNGEFTGRATQNRRQPEPLRNWAMLMGTGLFLLIGSVLTGTPVRAEECLIEVADVAWTDGVQGRECQYRYGKNARCRQIYLWMRVKGTQKALDQLRTEGKLPIRHKWFKLVGGKESWQENPELKDDIDLAVGKQEKIKKLELELEQIKFFDWRTWSMKEHLRLGWWGVRMVYANDEPVKCGPDHGDCEWVIEIR